MMLILHYQNKILTHPVTRFCRNFIPNHLPCDCISLSDISFYKLQFDIPPLIFHTESGTLVSIVIN